jgi:hypothetical protein
MGPPVAVDSDSRSGADPTVRLAVALQARLDLARSVLYARRGMIFTGSQWQAQ